MSLEILLGKSSTLSTSTLSVMVAYCFSEMHLVVEGKWEGLLHVLNLDLVVPLWFISVGVSEDILVSSMWECLVHTVEMCNLNKPLKIVSG